MDNIAVFYNEIIIYWPTILIFCGTLAGFIFSLSLYLTKNKYCYGFCIYMPVAVLLSVVFSRLLHWYCYREQYEGLGAAMKDYSSGGYLIQGVIFAVWLSAFLLAPLAEDGSSKSILDPMSVGLAFIIGVIKYSDIYSDLNRGKIFVGIEGLQHLPFAIATEDGDYRLATFCLSAIAMLFVFAVLIWFFFFDMKLCEKAGIARGGNVFRMFLVLYGAVEIVLDSMRYDQAHFYFPGEALAVLNKGTGFMGLGQLVGALFCLGIFIYYFIVSVKKNTFDKKNVVLLVIFVLGLALGGTMEYLVQRYFGKYKLWYVCQMTGVLAMVVSIFILYLYGMKDSGETE